MQPPKHGGVSLEVRSAIYQCSTSLLKRASASGVDISNRNAVLLYVKEHGREETRFALPPANVDLKDMREVFKYLDRMSALETHTGEQTRKAVERGHYIETYAALYGVRKERMEKLVQAGVDLRDRPAVRAALAAQGTQTVASPAPNPKTRAEIFEEARKEIQAHLAAQGAPPGSALSPLGNLPAPSLAKPTTSTLATAKKRARSDLWKLLQQMGVSPDLRFQVPAADILHSMSDEQIRAAIAAGVTINDSEALKEFLGVRNRPLPAKNQNQYTSKGRPRELLT